MKVKAKIVRTDRYRTVNDRFTKEYVIDDVKHIKHWEYEVSGIRIDGSEVSMVEVAEFFDEDFSLYTEVVIPLKDGRKVKCVFRNPCDMRMKDEEVDLYVAEILYTLENIDWKTPGELYVAGKRYVYIKDGNAISTPEGTRAMAKFKIDETTVKAYLIEEEEEEE